MLKQRFERLNALAKINSAAKYLEIGVSEGDTFTKVNVPYKVAVDPKFRFDFEKLADQNTRFHEVTSDMFFSELASEHGQFDLIYIDGLHTFEQTIRDFCTSLGTSHSRTIWLIDDTNPTGWLASIPDQELSRKLRRLVGIQTNQWMGDVFKLVFVIHDFFPQFSYATFPGHGQTVVWKETRKDFTPTWDSLVKISHLGYQDFLKFRDSHLSILEPDEILSSIENSLVLPRISEPLEIQT